ncbi:MAG: GAF domain-containing protein [Desulfobacterales bacterium]|nr:GAF domain-containing protein [Desulfobacterales bacterium]
MDSENKLFQTLKAINKISNTPRIRFNNKVQQILLEVTKCMGTGKGSIMITKGKKTLEVVASTNSDIIGIRQALDKASPSSWVVKNKKILSVDPKSDGDVFGNKFKHYAKDAFLVAPILSNNRVIGVINVTEKSGQDRFSRTEQESLLYIAGQVISDLENHRLAESLKNHKRILKKKNNKLEKLEKIKTDLFNMLIHDLKGPISEVMANIDILTYTISDEENLDYVKAAQSGCDTLFRMISDLLDIARLEEGNLSPLIEMIPPDDIINESLARLHGLITSKRIEIIQKTGDMPENISLCCDRGLILRVLQNLFTNAISYSAREDKIEVGCYMSNDGVGILFIRDNGPGIKEEFQEAIFDKYVQIIKKQDGRKYSTGLGLNFCKLAVEAHKGKIVVESDGIKGSCFKVMLPVYVGS